MNKLLQLYKTLLKTYGSQHWWPADGPFEVMIGAILTQNTAWTNVEKAIQNLKHKQLLTPQTIVNSPHEKLAECLRPSGYFNIKAKRLQNFCCWYQEQGGIKKLSLLDSKELRQQLLKVNGIGPETADDILLYAFERPVFVIDAYTRRLLQRLNWIKGDEDYETLRMMFETALGPDVKMFNEYHALIVRHAKDPCRKKPLCGECVLQDECCY